MVSSHGFAGMVSDCASGLTAVGLLSISSLYFPQMNWLSPVPFEADGVDCGSDRRLQSGDDFAPHKQHVLERGTSIYRRLTE